MNRPPTRVHPLARHWVGRLAHYRSHRNPEHLEALFEEAIRFSGFQLEADLADSEFWSAAPLLRRAAVLLFLIDRGVVFRRFERTGAVFYEVHPAAESWVAAQSALAAYVHPTYELLSALRNHQAQRLLRSGSA
jgi:hypothetical protein